MADNTPVNSQITDGITQANLTAIGEGPALVAMALYQTFAQAMSLAMQNAVNAQQQLNMASQVATARALEMILAGVGEDSGKVDKA